MNKIFGTLCATALALSVTGCGDTKKAASENKAEEPAAQAETAAPTDVSTETAVGTAAQIEGTKTITLSNGATVTWIQDNEGEKLMPRTLFSDASDSLYNSINMPDGIPASVSTFLVKVDGKYILFDAGLGAFLSADSSRNASPLSA